MKYYRVKEEADQIRHKKIRLYVKGELFTENEVSKYNLNKQYLEAVEVSKKDTYWLFGARFSKFNMNKRELLPRYANVASFYKKAWIIEEEDAIILQSYNSLVAKYNKATKELYFGGYGSQTTLRHIKEFMQQLGLCPIAKKEQIKLWETGTPLQGE